MTTDWFDKIDYS